MDCVVQSWIAGTLSDDLADAISSRGSIACNLWVALETQFLGNHETRTLLLDVEFHSFAQGDLSVTDYCRRFKRMADQLADLGAPVLDRTLVLNVLRRPRPERALHQHRHPSSSRAPVPDLQVGPS